MNSLFATPAYTLITSIVLGVNIVSLLVMCIIIFEFRHVHQKRVVLVKELGEKTHSMLLERRLLMLFYVVSTAIVIIAPLSVYL